MTTPSSMPFNPTTPLPSAEALATELITPSDYIRWGASAFNRAELYFGHGSDNSFDEARYLVLFALQLPFHLDERYLDARLMPSERLAVATLLLERITSRKPAAYLTHEAWFAGLSFYVDERVLIPRSPFAELIQNGFIPWVNPDQLERVLDLCTGSGCIAIATALALPHVAVVASDLSPEALAVAAINCQRHQAEVELIESDLFAHWVSGERFDLILSNPPYVETGELPILAAEYHYEPELALVSGEDGLDFVRRLLHQAADYLTESGVLIVEVGATQYQIEAAFPQLPFTWIELERGGSGIFTLTRSELVAATL